MRRSVVNAYFNRWRKRLGLSDWTLTLSVEPLTDSLGEADTYVRERKADIRLDSTFVKEKSSEEVELVIIHELLHVWIHFLVETNGNEVVEEQLIECLSNLLLTLSYAKPLSRYRE